MKAFPTVSHDEHKGMGGNPTGDRSVPELMVLLCRWRHQNGCASKDTKTLKWVYTTPARAAGPVDWYLRADILASLIGKAAVQDISPFGGFVMVAREAERVADGWTLRPLFDWQRQALVKLAEMQL